MPPRPEHEPLEQAAEADLCIVGGGFTGLWAAIEAKRRDSGQDVVLLEGSTVAAGASGRNGGFARYSLTHGIANGLSRFASEMPALERLGREFFADWTADIERFGIDCDLERTGALLLALEPHELGWLNDLAAVNRRFGADVELLGKDETLRQVSSPQYLGSLWTKSGMGLVDPAKLAEGLRETAVSLGVRIHERTPVLSLADKGEGRGIDLRTPHAHLQAKRVVLGTNAFRPLLRRLRNYVVPVYDHVLVSEPLEPEQLDGLGWANRQGLSDMGNQFHYYRLTADNRLLFGGFDANYRPRVAPEHELHDPTFARLSQHVAMIFPQLRDVRFTHRWGGAIDTCSRFSAFFGRACSGQLAYAIGYTGLGVVATRFGAHVALELLEGRSTEVTRLRYVRRKPLPFPPEPLRSPVIHFTQDRMAKADRSAGRRGLWLKTLDKVGLGFDS